MKLKSISIKICVTIEIPSGLNPGPKIIDAQRKGGQDGIHQINAQQGPAVAVKNEGSGLSRSALPGSERRAAGGADGRVVRYTGAARCAIHQASCWGTV